MSTHPNVILLLLLKPDGLTRKTLRTIFEKETTEGLPGDVPDLIIAEKTYHVKVMECDYDEGWQISGDEGDIAIFDLVTYGYGDSVSWIELEKQKNDLEKWAIMARKKYSCTYQIKITANYW